MHTRRYNQPDERGYFGTFGGRFVPETLMQALYDLEEAYITAKNNPSFQDELDHLLKTYAGRPTPLYFASRLTDWYGAAKIYFKREDLCHTGAHKINNVLGQVLLARNLGKKRIIAETGAGQHGVATATAATRMGLECVVYMGREDMLRQEQNVNRMRLLGAEVRSVDAGSRTLKDATNEAIRDWVTNIRDTFYVIGSVVGPHPYPMMVRDFQSIIGKEVKQQVALLHNRLPDYLVACVGGGSNAIGLFYPFIDDGDVRMYGIEAGGYGVQTSHHAATLTMGKPGVLHGCLSYLLQDANGQVMPAHSVSAGLDYPGVGPEHSYLKTEGRVTYDSVTDYDALSAAVEVTQLEGILPALETAHALAYLRTLTKRTSTDDIVVVNVSGRGEKDLSTILEYFRKKHRHEPAFS